MPKSPLQPRGNSLGRTRAFKQVVDIIDKSRKPESPINGCKQFLRAVLAEEDLTVKQVKALAAEGGFEWKWVQAAKKEVGVEASYVDNVWYWSLPQKEAEPVVTTTRVDEENQDAFSLSREERAALGIKPGEGVRAVQDPRYWDKHALYNEVKKLERQGCRLARDEKGEMVQYGLDTVMMIVPTELMEKKRAFDENREKEHFKYLNQPIVKDEEDFDPTNPQMIQMRKLQNTEMHRQTGMIGPMSPSQGRPYEDYIRDRGLTEAQIEHEELTYALGNGYEAHTDPERIAEVMGRGKGQSRDSSGKFFSLPPNVRPRNLQPAR